MIIRRDDTFQYMGSPVRSRFTLDGDYASKPRYSIAGRLFSEYGSRGTGLTRSLKLGYSSNGYYVNDYMYNVNNDADAQKLIKDVMDSDDHNAFSKNMYNLFKHMLKGSNMVSNCSQRGIADGRDVNVTGTLDNLSIKDSNGSILIPGIEVWDNMVGNVDSIDTQMPQTPQTEYMIYDAKVHILNKMCIQYKLSIFIAAADLSYTNMKSKNMCDKVYRSRLRVPVIGSAILYGLYENYTEISSLNDALYKCDRIESLYDGKKYHDVVLTDLISSDAVRDIETTHLYNAKVDGTNGYTDITALGHKARQIFILECVTTGRVVEAVNMLIGNTSTNYLNARSGMSEGYVKEMILSDEAHVISDMYGISDWTIKDKIKEEIIESNSKDKDIYWLNTFVKWYHIINTCNTVLSIFTAVKGMFFKKDMRAEKESAAVRNPSVKPKGESDTYNDTDKWVM